MQQDVEHFQIVFVPQNVGQRLGFGSLGGHGEGPCLSQKTGLEDGGLRAFAQIVKGFRMAA